MSTQAGVGMSDLHDAPAAATAAARYASIGDGEPRAAAGDIARQLMGHPAGLLVLLPDPLAVPPDHLLHELGRAAPGFEAIGAAASGDPALRGTFQFYGRNVASRSL